MKSPSVRSLAKTMTHAKKLGLVTMTVSLMLVPDLLWHKLTFILHLSYEVISFGLELILTDVFGIGKQLSQMAVFYLLWLLGFLLLYRFWRNLPKLFMKFKTDLQALTTRLKYRTFRLWLKLSIDQKIKLLIFQFAGVIGVFMFLLA
ncbi:hypothetical protein [Methylomonas sp. MgM2]